MNRSLLRSIIWIVAAKGGNMGWKRTSDGSYAIVFCTVPAEQVEQALGHPLT
jgi:hypothetical protein